VNSRGFPTSPAPRIGRRPRIRGDVNQYAITWGAKGFREALAAKTRRCTGMEVDPESEITVTCGSTEAMIAALLAVVDPGDEVIVFEPFYENYGPDAVLCGATPRFVPLRPVTGEGGGRSWDYDPDELRRAFGPRTRAVILNHEQPDRESSHAPSWGGSPRASARLPRDHRRDLQAHHVRRAGTSRRDDPRMRERTI
jgi:aminotransferase